MRAQNFESKDEFNIKLKGSASLNQINDLRVALRGCFEAERLLTTLSFIIDAWIFAVTLWWAPFSTIPTQNVYAHDTFTDKYYQKHQLTITAGVESTSCSDTAARVTQHKRIKCREYIKMDNMTALQNWTQKWLHFKIMWGRRDSSSIFICSLCFNCSTVAIGISYRVWIPNPGPESGQDRFW